MLNKTEKEKILSMVELYCQSAIHAEDLSIAEKVWAQTPDVTFIHPRGHEKGWEEVKQNFYINTMVGNCDNRHLQVIGTPHVVFYGDTAVVEFYWEFSTVFKHNQIAVTTTGRESQVYAKIPELGWRLLQVHYSGEPVTGQGEGF